MDVEEYFQFVGLYNKYQERNESEIQTWKDLDAKVNLHTFGDLELEEINLDEVDVKGIDLKSSEDENINKLENLEIKSSNNIKSTHKKMDKNILNN